MSVCESAGAPVSEAIDGAISAKLLPTILSILKDNPEMADIGIFASLDPVALDQSCYDASLFIITATDLALCVLTDS